MARRKHLARWAAGLCLVTAGTFHFAAPAEALEVRMGVLLPPLPLPVVLPSELAVTLPLPDFSVLSSQPAQPLSAEPDPSPPPVVPDPAVFTPPGPSATALPVLASQPAQPPSAEAGPTPPPDEGGGLVDTAGRFSLPLGLTAALIAFLAVQALVDRRDPKLAVAPMDDEVFGFR